MAEWTAAYINDLPDSAFAVILPGGEKDADGRTVPRDLRKLPHHNAEGAVDMAHLRNAMSREPQADMPAEMHSRAESHLQGHMEQSDEPRTALVDATIEVRDIAKREVDMRILPWDMQIDTMLGPEEFKRGAFDSIRPEDVYLYGTNHEMRFGLGQNGQPVPTRVPVGRASRLWVDDIGQMATFRVARTAAGDEALGLMSDGIVTGVSAEFSEIPGGTSIETRNGRRVRIHNRARLSGATPTNRPAYGERAAVLAVRQEEEGQMPETTEATVAAPPAPVVVDMTSVDAAIAAIDARNEAREARIEARFAEQAEQFRGQFTIPSAAEPVVDARSRRGDWAGAVLRMLSGERVADSQMRELADLVTADNIGVVPDAFLNDLIGVIDPTRPFLSSTRRLDLPPAGMSLVVPKIVTRPTTGVQAIYGDESFPEKSDVTSTATSISNVTFDAITIAGGGDISIQLLKRSSPSYLSLFIELLGEAYAANGEALALDALLSTVGGAGGVNDGGTLDPDNLVLATAWAAGAANKKPITTIWLSSAAVGAFIDAKASGTNAPLYSQIQAGFTAGAGPAGTISGLRPVYVPELDNTAYDVLVGPSSGFGWTEDGTFTLQVDNPAKAGRDVALVGIMWFAPMYPTAFTAYVIGS